MNSVFLVTILLLDIYVICFRLRFKLDPAGYLILLTQLVVLIFRLWMGRSSIYIHWQQWLQASVIYVGYIINETTLMFFMFEMKFVKLKTESTSLENYNQAKRPVEIVKYWVIAAELLIMIPFGLVSQVLSSEDDRDLYYNLIFWCLVITRICYLIVVPYTYT